MTLTRKDAEATVLVALAVAVFFAYHQSWGVPLVGDSIRWAAGAVALLGAMTCSVAQPDRLGGPMLPSTILGIAALVLVVTTLVFGSLTLFSLLVVDIVALWLVSTIRHGVVVQGQRPLPH
jgi:hypothetical protein